MGRWILAGLGGVLLSLAVAEPAQAREHVLPERNDDRASRDVTWDSVGGWLQSPAIRPAHPGGRVAALISVRDARTVPLQARGVPTNTDGQCTGTGTDGAGPWLAMEETFSGSELRVAVLDLPEKYPCAQIRVAQRYNAVVGDLQWELLDPRYPNVGRASRSFVAKEVPQHAIPSELEMIGVITREEWEARATQCSAIEDDWYRMAIHHTAGPQTAGGTVIERLQGTQAYAMDSGTYCDIPYQMLGGFDGTLYEGRGLDLVSGATGGGQNPGNLAVCFIGCYHEPESDCVGGEGHDPTDEMMLRGQLFVQTLVRLEDIETSEDVIRGHRDWPGNSTACPGSLLHPRLGELREDLTWFAGLEVERSWDEAELDVPLETTTEVWVDLENTGGLAWEPGETFLAPTPRDEPSPLYDEAWPTMTRAATVESTVEPGETGRFLLPIRTGSETPVTQSFGLVHEGTTWFADAPWGGGPADDAIIITVRGTAVSASTGSNETNSDSSTSVGEAGTGGDEPSDGGGTTGEQMSSSSSDGASQSDDQGCGCRSRGGAPWGLAMLVLLVAGRRRPEQGHSRMCAR